MFRCPMHCLFGQSIGFLKTVKQIQFGARLHIWSSMKTPSASIVQRVACLLQPVHRQLDELLLLIEPVGGEQRLYGGVAVESAFGDEQCVGLLLQNMLHPFRGGIHGLVQPHAVEHAALVGLVVVRTRDGVDAPRLAVLGGVGVLGGGVAGVGYLDAVSVQVAHADGVQVPAHPEGVGLDHAAAGGADVFVGLLARPALDLRVIQQILLIHAVDEVLIALEVLLDAEEYVQADLLSFVPGILKAGAIVVDAVLPVAGAGRGGVAAKEMVGDEDALIAPLFVKPGVLRAGGGAAGAALAGVHMGFVAIHGMASLFKRSFYSVYPFCGEMASHLPECGRICLLQMRRKPSETDLSIDIFPRSCYHHEYRDSCYQGCFSWQDGSSPERSYC